VRAVRYLLQALLLLLAAGVMVPLAVSGKASYAALLGLGAFFGFLLFLTVLLREHTESRLVSGLLRLSIEYLGPWPAAAFFLAFGACMLCLAFRLFRSR
jgi:hypothetical protein